MIKVKEVENKYLKYMSKLLLKYIIYLYSRGENFMKKNVFFFTIVIFTFFYFSCATPTAISSGQLDNNVYEVKGYRNVHWDEQSLEYTRKLCVRDTIRKACRISNNNGYTHIRILDRKLIEYYTTYEGDNTKYINSYEYKLRFEPATAPLIENFAVYHSLGLPDLYNNSYVLNNEFFELIYDYD